MFFQCFVAQMLFVMIMCTAVTALSYADVKIQHDMEWDSADGVRVVNGRIVVERSCLTILQGVHIVFNSTKGQIEVRNGGCLRVKGTLENKVVVTGLTTWNGITFSGGEHSRERSSLEYLKVMNTSVDSIVTSDSLYLSNVYTSGRLVVLANHIEMKASIIAGGVLRGYEKELLQFPINLNDAGPAVPGGEEIVQTSEAQAPVNSNTGSFPQMSTNGNTGGYNSNTGGTASPCNSNTGGAGTNSPGGVSNSNTGAQGTSGNTGGTASSGSTGGSVFVTSGFVDQSTSSNVNSPVGETAPIVYQSVQTYETFDPTLVDSLEIDAASNNLAHSQVSGTKDAFGHSSLEFNDVTQMTENTIQQSAGLHSSLDEHSTTDIVASIVQHTTELNLIGSSFDNIEITIDDHNSPTTVLSPSSGFLQSIMAIVDPSDSTHLLATDERSLTYSNSHSITTTYDMSDASSSLPLVQEISLFDSVQQESNIESSSPSDESYYSTFTDYQANLNIESILIDPCKRVILRAESDVIGAEYSWYASGPSIDQRFDDLQQIEVDMITRNPGTYTFTVYTMERGLQIKKSVSVVKRPFVFGENCSSAITLLASFSNGRLNRKSKNTIKTYLETDLQLTYAWSIEANGAALRFSDFALTGANMPNVIFRADIPENLKMRLTLRLNKGIETMYMFSASLSLAGKSLVTGSLSVQPLVAATSASLRTKYLMEATQWASDIPLMYTYGYLDVERNANVTIQKTNSSSLVTDLPAGLEQENYSLRVFVTASNEIGEEETAFSTVRVDDSVISPRELISYARSIAEGPASNFASAALALSVFIKRSERTLTDSSTRQTYSDAVDQLSNRALEIIKQRLVTSSIQILEVLSAVTESSLISPSSQEISLEAISASLEQEQLEQGFLSVTGRIISNIVDRGLSNSTVAHSTLRTVEDIVEKARESAIPSDEPILLDSSSFKLLVQLDYANLLANRTVVFGSSIRIPSSFSSQLALSDHVVSYAMASYRNNPYQSSSTELTGTDVLDLTFRYENGTVIAVQGLEEPLSLSLQANVSLTSDLEVECSYWNEQSNAWMSDGCVWSKEQTTENVVVCQCSHTTSFSAFILYKGKENESAPGVYAVGLIFNTLFVALSFVVLVCLMFVTRDQPVRSRFIAPWLGMLAILVDALLQGWVRNSLGLARKWGAMDSVAYVIMLVSNPLTIAALFVFLWQHIRFVLLQHLYHLMRTSKSKQSLIMRVCRVIVSKMVFAASTIAVALATFAVFLILVCVAATRTTGSQTDNVVIAQAVIFSAMMIVLALLIGSVFLLDFGIALSRRRTAKSDQNTRSFFGTYFGDVLLFRVEVIFILVIVLIMLVYFPLGIATVVKQVEPKAASSIVRTIFEILYMFARIVSFGGFITGYAVYRRLFIAKRVKNSAEMSEGSDTALLSLLNNPHGYKVMEEYCAEEFSLENLLLYTELQEIQDKNSILTSSERRHCFEGIYELYLRNNAERQLNCENKVRKAFEEFLAKPELTTQDSEEILTKLHNACIMNLSDTFVRLSSTSMYQSHMKAKSVATELEDRM